MANKLITKKTNLGEILEKYPKAAGVLADKYQLHCIGCFAAAFENLGQGAKAHGMTDKEIKAMLEELNLIAAKSKPPAPEKEKAD